MNESQIDRILDGLQELAGKLGEAAEIVWAAIVRQQIIQGTALTLAALGMLVVAYVGTQVQRRIELEEKKLRANFSPAAWSAGRFAIWGAAGVVAATFGFWGIGHLLNPTWYALKELADLLVRGQ